MREWVGVPEGDEAAWRALAEEALRFVRGRAVALDALCADTPVADIVRAVAEKRPTP